MMMGCISSLLYTDHRDCNVNTQVAVFRKEFCGTGVKKQAVWVENSWGHTIMDWDRSCFPDKTPSVSIKFKSRTNAKPIILWTKSYKTECYKINASTFPQTHTCMRTAMFVSLIQWVVQLQKTFPLRSSLAFLIPA